MATNRSVASKAAGSKAWAESLQSAGHGHGHGHGPSHSNGPSRTSQTVGVHQPQTQQRHHGQQSSNAALVALTPAPVATTSATTTAPSSTPSLSSAAGGVHALDEFKAGLNLPPRDTRVQTSDVLAEEGRRVRRISSAPRASEGYL